MWVKIEETVHKQSKNNLLSKINVNFYFSHIKLRQKVSANAIFCRIKHDCQIIYSINLPINGKDKRITNKMFIKKNLTKINKIISVHQQKKEKYTSSVAPARIVYLPMDIKENYISHA